VFCSLAATPETENHGAALALARDSMREAPAHARLLVLVDESPYLKLIGTDTSLASRIEQRREAWRSFVGQHGMPACLAGLADLAGSAVIDPALPEAVRRCSVGARR